MKESAPASPLIEISQAARTRELCILLLFEAVVSYRSVPRILKIMQEQVPLQLPWIPHFTSVINWSLRLGLGLLQQVKKSNEKWLAIIDHSISIGTRKVLVVLRVSMDSLLEKQGAIQLSDCECIGLRVSEKVTGESIALELQEIFDKSGHPAAIIKDGECALEKGVRLWSEPHESRVPVIYDVGHAFALALEKQYKEDSGYKRLVEIVTQGAKKLRQTAFGFLTPPQLRSKGRFMSIGRLAKWGEKILELSAGTKKLPQGVLQKISEVFPDLNKSREFIQEFSYTTNIMSNVLKRLKNKGLEQSTYVECREWVDKLPENSCKESLLCWLERHLLIQKQISPSALLVSSDIIESLFGNFKHVIERCPQADINRMALLIPAFCGKINVEIINQSLSCVRHVDLIEWENNNIPYTMRGKRLDIFNNDNPKIGKNMT